MNKYAKITAAMIAASVAVPGASLAFADEVNTKDVVGAEAIEKNVEPTVVEKTTVENVSTANTETTAAPAVSTAATAQATPADEFEQFKGLAKSFLEEYFVNANTVLIAGDDLGKGLCVLSKGTGMVEYMNDGTKVSGNPDGTTVIRGDNKNFYIIGTPKFADDANGDEYVEAGIMRGDIEFKYIKLNGSEDRDYASWIMFKDKATYDKFVKWQDLNVAVDTRFGLVMKHIKPNYTEAAVMTGPEKGEVIKNEGSTTVVEKDKNGNEHRVDASGKINDDGSISIHYEANGTLNGKIDGNKFEKESAGFTPSATGKTLPKTGDTHTNTPIVGIFAAALAAAFAGIRRFAKND